MDSQDEARCRRYVAALEGVMRATEGNIWFPRSKGAARGLPEPARQPVDPSVFPALLPHMSAEQIAGTPAFDCPPVAIAGVTHYIASDSGYEWPMARGTGFDPDRRRALAFARTHWQDRLVRPTGWHAVQAIRLLKGRSVSRVVCVALRRGPQRGSWQVAYVASNPAAMREMSCVKDDNVPHMYACGYCGSGVHNGRCHGCGQKVPGKLYEPWSGETLAFTESGWMRESNVPIRQPHLRPTEPLLPEVRQHLEDNGFAFRR